MNEKRPFVLPGEKISLTPLIKEDVEKLWVWINDKETTQFLVSYNRMYSKEAEIKWLEEALHKIDQPVFGIIEKEQNNLIGVASLEVNYINNITMLGIFIGEKKLWDRGYGTEAVILLLDYAFYVLNMHKVWLSVYDFNKRAIRVYEKVGFHKVGELREHIRKDDDKYANLILMDILKREFDELHQSKVKELAKARYSSF